jgi:phytoene dehydrogenase-like protein
MGGLITGALLAKLDRRRVLVLEKEAEIGGRVLSYGGPHGTYTEKEYRQLLQGGSGVRVARTQPALGEIIEEKGLFRNYIIDSGWHGVSAGNRCRYSLLAKALGKSLPVAPQVGLLFCQDGEFLELTEVVKSWPAASRKERNRIAHERLCVSTAESGALDHVDLHSYLESVTPDPLVRDYFTLMAKFQTGINDAGEISAGDWIRCNNMTSATGAHLSHGGGMGDVAGGFKNIANCFADVIRESGGEVRTNARVRRIVIDDHHAAAVDVEYGRHDRASETIEAPVVVSNLPMDTVYGIVPEGHFPKEMRERIAHIQPMTGILGHIGLRGLLEHHWPKGMFVLDALPGPSVKGGQPAFGFEQTSVIDPGRVVRGNGHIVQCWVGLWTRDPDEAHDRELVDRLIDAQLDWFRRQYPDFDDLLDWFIFVVAERVYGITPTPGFIGDRRPTVQHPTIRNLFFTGDTVTQTDYGTSGAAHGGMLCANAISGRDFLTLLPEYMR